MPRKTSLHTILGFLSFTIINSRVFFTLIWSTSSNSLVKSYWMFFFLGCGGLINIVASCWYACSATVKECKEALCRLSIELLDILIEGLGINPNDFDVYKRDMQAVLRANYYHRTDSQEQVIGLRPHMDGTFITLLLQDDVAGLEVMKDGEWFCVKPERNAICVHFGDMLEVNSSCIIHPIYTLLT